MLFEQLNNLFKQRIATTPRVLQPTNASLEPQRPTPAGTAGNDMGHAMPIGHALVALDFPRIRQPENVCRLRPRRRIVRRLAVRNELEVETEGIDQLQHGRQGRVRVRGGEQPPHNLRPSFDLPSQLGLAHTYEEPGLVERSDQRVGPRAPRCTPRQTQGPSSGSGSTCRTRSSCGTWLSPHPST